MYTLSTQYVASSAILITTYVHVLRRKYCVKLICYRDEEQRALRSIILLPYSQSTCDNFSRVVEFLVAFSHACQTVINRRKSVAVNFNRDYATRSWTKISARTTPLWEVCGVLGRKKCFNDVEVFFLWILFCISIGQGARIQIPFRCTSGKKRGCWVKKKKGKKLHCICAPSYVFANF